MCIGKTAIVVVECRRGGEQGVAREKNGSGSIMRRRRGLRNEQEDVCVQNEE